MLKVCIKNRIFTAYSQLVSANLAIILNKTFCCDLKPSFFRAIQLFLYRILRMKASENIEKSVPLGMYFRMSLVAFSIAPFYLEE